MQIAIIPSIKKNVMKDVESRGVYTEKLKVLYIHVKFYKFYSDIIFF